MSSAHVFYIPLLILVGLCLGYFLGRRAADQEARELDRRARRREALRRQQRPRGGSGGGDAPHASSAGEGGSSVRGGMPLPPSSQNSS